MAIDMPTRTESRWKNSDISKSTSWPMASINTLPTRRERTPTCWTVCGTPSNGRLTRTVSSRWFKSPFPYRTKRTNRMNWPTSHGIQSPIFKRDQGAWLGPRENIRRLVIISTQLAKESMLSDPSKRNINTSTFNLQSRCSFDCIFPSIAMCAVSQIHNWKFIIAFPDLNNVYTRATQT